MKILVLNCGSTSLKASVLDTEESRCVADLSVERMDEQGLDHAGAVKRVLCQLDEMGQEVEAVGHRVVHGGDRFTDSVRIDEDVLGALEEQVDLAPLHLPANLATIRAAMVAYSKLPHVAVFDTAFHHTLPNRARHYALPRQIAAEHGVRRYGFHGTSHQWVAEQAAAFLGEPLRELRLITCHLGGGCSVCAVEFGRSVETSMGLTPVEGLVMATRCGDVDAGALIHLGRRLGLDLDGLDDLVNRESGLKGLSGVSGDLRDIEARAADGDADCRRAIGVFAHRVRKYIGAYAAVMGGVDAIVLTGGIGQNATGMRQRILQRLDFLGARLDEDRNRDCSVTAQEPVACISVSESRTPIVVVFADEAAAIAGHTRRIVEQSEPAGARTIPVAISARHVHLDRVACDALFGEGHELTPRRPVTQPGQYACEERVDIIGPKRTLERVGIIGPLRGRSQVELAQTDEFTLGIDAPIRCSGDLDNTPGITLRGPAGTYTLQEGVIQAQRHIHMHPDDATHFGVGHKDIVEVRIDSGGRDLTFGDVVVRVKDSYKLEMHVDTDEGNAAGVCRGMTGEIAMTPAEVKITKRK